MKKRDMETRKTEFLEQVIANITYMDLQGVFSDNGHLLLVLRLLIYRKMNLIIFIIMESQCMKFI